MSEPNHFTQADREAIIRLTVTVERVIIDIKNLTDVVDWRLVDHEGRLRNIERAQDDFQLIKKIVYWMVTMILVSFLGIVINFVMR